MIHLEWLNSLPACQLALESLTKHGAAPHPFQCHLVTLLLDYLDRLPVGPDPKGYVVDLRQAACEMAFPGGAKSQARAAGLMCGDHEQLELDLGQNPGKEQQVLAEHLGQLHREMQDRPREVGQVLAENLANSLH